MQPYSSANDDKGLFTFYRQMADLESNPNDVEESSEKLKKILEKVQRQKKEDLKSKPLNHIRKDKQLKSVNESKLKAAKSHRSSEKSNLDVKLLGSPRAQQYPLVKMDSELSRIGSNTEASQHVYYLDSQQLEDNKEQKFIKYRSHLDAIMQKRNKMRSCQHPQELKSERHERQPKVADESLTSRQKKQRNSESKFKNYFRRLALEPHEFDGVRSGMLDRKDELVSNCRKKEKTALKAIKKKKTPHDLTQDQRLSSRYAQSSREQKLALISFQKKKGLEQIKVDYSQKENTKLIRVKKIDREIQQVSESTEARKEKKSVPLPRISKEQKQTQLVDAGLKKEMSIELMQNYNLRNKYKINKLEKQGKAMMSLKEDLRERSRNQKQQNTLHHNISFRKSGSEVSSDSCHQQKGEIFCKKSEYLKNYPKILKGNVMKDLKSDSIVLQKSKQKLLTNLMENLNF